MDGAVSAPMFAEREAFHLERLRARSQAEAAADGTIQRMPWGWLFRDSERGRRLIARELARLELAFAEVA
jgi:hypothetical protein